jgi:HSP20 family protein
MANVTRHGPFPGLDKMFRRFRLMPLSMPREFEGVPQLKIDVGEDEKAYTVNAGIPGAKKKDIRVTVDGKQISISAEVKRETAKKEGDRVLHSERYYGNSYRGFTLDSAVDDAAAQAKYSDGLLQLTLPKKANGGPGRLRVS